MGREELKQAEEEIKTLEELQSGVSIWGDKSQKVIDTVIIALSVILAIFHVYTGVWGLREFYIQRGLHLFLVMLIGALILLRESNKKYKAASYVVLLAAVLIPFIHFFGDFSYFQLRLWGVGFRQSDIITGIILVAACFVLGQSAVGWVMPSITAISILYLFIGPYAPGILEHGGYSMKFVTELSSWSEIGIFSTPLGVASSYLYLFILFGTLIEQMGTGATLVEVAKCVAGRSKGGPAKIAVVSSALMGSISGSPVANVLTTGAFTIPFMKKLGFEPEYAGAVEAVASTGGMILPPVMGVLAFAMVDYAGIPYSKIILSAFIPAMMYYMACYFTVHLHSIKLDMKPMDKSEITPMKEILRKDWLTIIPVFVLAIPLCMGYTPLVTVSWATVSLIPISFFGPKERRLTPSALVKCFVKSARNIRIITFPCALAGIISGALSVTGVGVRLSSILLEVANGNLTILLLLVALITIIMGCGLPSLLAYIIQLPVTIPAMISMGVPVIGAHLFVVYFATLAFITPPVGMSLYAAAGLANSSFMKTGWAAMKIGAAGFIAPFVFVFCPSLLLLEFNLVVLLDCAFAILSVFVLAAAVEGFWGIRLNPLLRTILFACALGLFVSSRLVGAASLITILAIYIYTNKMAKKTTGTA